MLLSLLAFVAVEYQEQYVTLYDKHWGRVVNMAKWYVHDNHYAEDIAQATFIKLAGYMEKIKGQSDSECVAFINVVLRSTAITHYNKLSKDQKTHAPFRESFDNPKYESFFVDIFSEVEMEIESQDAYEKLDSFMRGVLTDREHEIITARFFAGLKAKEVALLFNSTKGAVDQRVYTAKKKLIAEYKRLGITRYEEYADQNR